MSNSLSSGKVTQNGEPNIAGRSSSVSPDSIAARTKRRVFWVQQMVGYVSLQCES